MEAIDKKQAYDGMVKHISRQVNEQGGAYPNWYCGIATDLNERVFDDHNVPKENHWWTARRCYNHEDARAVENDLLALGCDGGSGGGDETTVYVYAYLKGTMTDP